MLEIETGKPLFRVIMFFIIGITRLANFLFILVIMRKIIFNKSIKIKQRRCRYG